MRVKEARAARGAGGEDLDTGKSLPMSTTFEITTSVEVERRRREDWVEQGVNDKKIELSLLPL